MQPKFGKKICTQYLEYDGIVKKTSHATVPKRRMLCGKLEMKKNVDLILCSPPPILNCPPPLPPPPPMQVHAVPAGIKAMQACVT